MDTRRKFFNQRSNNIKIQVTRKNVKVSSKRVRLNRTDQGGVAERKCASSLRRTCELDRPKSCWSRQERAASHGTAKSLDVGMGSRTLTEQQT